jgi:hypothetical protein
MHYLALGHLSKHRSKWSYYYLGHLEGTFSIFLWMNAFILLISINKQTRGLECKPEQNKTLALSTTYVMVNKKCPKIIIRLPKCLSLLDKIHSYKLLFLVDLSSLTFDFQFISWAFKILEQLACLDSDLFSLCLGSYSFNSNHDDVDHALYRLYGRRRQSWRSMEESEILRSRRSSTISCYLMSQIISTFTTAAAGAIVKTSIASFIY